jgi:hypothetical protein
MNLDQDEIISVAADGGLAVIDVPHVRNEGVLIAFLTVGQVCATSNRSRHNWHIN